jgi:LmbE family N-acetylglucosaminyl deacetylase
VTRITIVAAHHDDAAIALGGSIAAGFLHRPVVVTVFSRSDFTRWGRQGVAATTQRRAEENRRALAGATMQLIDLDFPDLPLRKSMPAVGDAVASLASSTDICLFPAPCHDAHPDHLTLSCLASELAGTICVGFYQDALYASSDDFEHYAGASQLCAVKLPCLGFLYMKAQMLLCYSSQLAAASVAKIINQMRRTNGELVAVPSGASGAFVS